MGRILKALVSTVLIIEIASIFSETTVWVVVSELHLPGVVMIPALVLTGLGMLVLAVPVFRLALRAERRMEEDAANPPELILPSVKPPGTLNPNEIAGTARPRVAMPPAGVIGHRPKRDRSSP